MRSSSRTGFCVGYPSRSLAFGLTGGISIHTESIISPFCLVKVDRTTAAPGRINIVTMQPSIFILLEALNIFSVVPLVLCVKFDTRQHLGIK